MDDLAIRLKELGIEPMNSEVFDPVSESELMQIEKEIGSTLPYDYRWFLSRYGRSIFGNAVVCPSLNQLEELTFSFFFGSKSSGSGVLDATGFFKEQFPSGVLPIAEASFCDMYLLATATPNRGNVYFWYHDGAGWESEEERFRRLGQDVPDSLKYTGLEQVASSFSEFVLKLESCKD
ncbi:MAG: SMI1/KNR4 family protein [Planctomycetia bacterium]